ncbi:MAG: hypothetical protein MUF61_02235, partial [archaeon]|nr:hypothetical protein [archaeon]
MMLNDFRNDSPQKLQEIFTELNYNQEKVKNFWRQFNRNAIDALENLKAVKNIAELAKRVAYKPLQFIASLKDQYGNEKFVFKTWDGYNLESVLMPSKKNISICVSSQIGCRFGCKFCQTAKMGLIRNLDSFEILEQLRQIAIRRIYPERLSCVSFMGMGEPLDNLA